MKIHRMNQGTAEWHAIRAGIPTASEFKNLVSPKKMEIRKGETPQTYLMKKLAEKWLGRPMESFQAHGAVTVGKVLEDEAIPALELLENIEIERVGFVTDDAGAIGCSPDGLIPGSGAEIKCPQADTHIGYLLDGVVPDDYVAQVQGSMLVTGASVWTFMSYCRELPPLIIHVNRNEEFIAILAEALAAFNEKLDRMYKRLVELNEGEPKRHAVSYHTEGDVTTATLAGVDSDELEAFLSSETFEHTETL